MAPSRLCVFASLRCDRVGESICIYLRDLRPAALGGWKRAVHHPTDPSTRSSDDLAQDDRQFGSTPSVLFCVFCGHTRRLSVPPCLCGLLAVRPSWLGGFVVATARVGGFRIGWLVFVSMNPGLDVEETTDLGGIEKDDAILDLDREASEMRSLARTSDAESGVGSVTGAVRRAHDIATGRIPEFARFAVVETHRKVAAFVFEGVHRTVVHFEQDSLLVEGAFFVGESESLFWDFFDGRDFLHRLRIISHPAGSTMCESVARLRGRG